MWYTYAQKSAQDLSAQDLSAQDTSAQQIPTNQPIARTWFTGDTHFGHNGVFKKSYRPYKSAIEMDDALVNNWNSFVSPEDTVYHIGDFANYGNTAQTASLREKLNGKIHLIVGNHDSAKTYPERLRDYGKLFETVQNESHIQLPRADGSMQPVYLNHYPQRPDATHGEDEGEWALYGHEHGFQPHDPNRKAMDVGVDAHGYKPVSWERVQHLMLNASSPAPTRAVGATGKPQIDYSGFPDAVAVQPAPQQNH